MKLYLISGTYFGTQAEAKPAAVAAGIKVSAIGDHEVEVPTDKAGLIGYLNGLSAVKPLALGPGCVNPALVASAEAAAGIDWDAPADEDRSPLTDTYHIERAVRAAHNISVEEEIANADFPTALRLAEHATSRVGEHLKAIADERFPKPTTGYQKSATLSELLS